MKKYLVIFLTLISIGARSQSLYEIKFNGADGKNNYTCFLVYYNENDCYMRISYYNTQSQYRVVDVKYAGKSGKYSDGVSYFSLTGINPRFITTQTDGETYNPDYFVWIGNESLPYTTDKVPDANGNRTVYKVVSYKKLNVKDLTKEYLRSFYGDQESDYLALLKMSENDTYTYTKPKNTNTTLHLIIMANTNIYDIGQGCAVDMNHISNEAESIANTLGIAFDQHLIYGNSFTKQNLLNAIDNMTVSSNDIVLFFYRGHGFRWTDQTSYYPALALTTAHSVPVTSDNTILLETIYSRIVAKGARLNLVLGDCCNSSIGIPQWSNDNYLYLQSNASAEYDKLNELFMKRQGNLLFAASKAGEVSWTNSMYGGFFTTSFLQALVEEISYMRTTESSWKDIVANTGNYALSKSTNCSGCSMQHAIYDNKITKL